jgi:hypothetical protein
MLQKGNVSHYGPKVKGKKLAKISAEVV